MFHTDSDKFGARALFAAAALLFLGLAVRAATPDAPSPIDQLRVWAGHWALQIHAYQTKYSTAETRDGDSQCAWLPRKRWMVCDILAGEVNAQRGKPDNNLSVFTYSDLDKQYRNLKIDEEGSVTPLVASIDGNKWVTPWECDSGKGVKRFCKHTYTFVSPEKFLFTFEISEDNQHWTLLDDGAATRVHTS